MVTWLIICDQNVLVQYMYSVYVGHELTIKGKDRMADGSPDYIILPNSLVCIYSV